MYYRNISCSVKTFHGVTFKPGETKEVQDYITNKFMILVDNPDSIQVVKQQKPSPEKHKQDAKPNKVKAEKKQEAQVVECPVSEVAEPQPEEPSSSQT